MIINGSLDASPRNQQRLSIATGVGNCVIIYRAPTDEDLDAHQWRIASLLGQKGLDQGKLRTQIAKAQREAVIVGWEGITDGKQPIEFSQDRLLALMLRVAPVESAVIDLLDRLYQVESIAGEPQRPLDAGTGAVASTSPGQPSYVDSTLGHAEPASPNTSE